MGHYVRKVVSAVGRYNHTTRKKCDGCSRPPTEVALRVVQVKVAPGIVMPFTYCRRCERLDAEIDRKREREVRIPTPQEIVNARPWAPPKLALGWTTYAILPRYRPAG